MLRLCSLLRYCCACAIVLVCGTSTHAAVAQSTRSGQTVGAPVLQANELVVSTPTESLLVLALFAKSPCTSAPVSTLLDQRQHLSIFLPALEQDLTFTRGAGTPRRSDASTRERSISRRGSQPAECHLKPFATAWGALVGRHPRTTAADQRCRVCVSLLRLP